MKITIVGAGYVGLANSYLLGATEEVTLIDIDETKVKLLQKGVNPISDDSISEYKGQVNIRYTTSIKSYIQAEIIFIATNTDYDEKLGKFDVSSIEKVMKDIDGIVTSQKIIVIKSTIPVGYTEQLKKRYTRHEIIFSPEFLREGSALYDSLYPDRIVIGDTTMLGKKVGTILAKNSLKDKIPILLMNSREAEVVKLFANAYLATRVSFVNELDTYCRFNKLETANVLNAIGCDYRIGKHYFNPSFGYGGYCLPKDTKQLKYEYEKAHINSPLINSITISNQKRKEFIAEQIISSISEGDVVGFYRMTVKKGVNNFRTSAVVDVIKLLKKRSVNIIVYEPALIMDTEFNMENNLEKFKNKSSLIVANRLDKEISECKVFTTDVYNEY